MSPKISNPYFDSSVLLIFFELTFWKDTNLIKSNIEGAICFLFSYSRVNNFYWQFKVN